jgi:hypothetical protein
MQEEGKEKEKKKKEKGTSKEGRMERLEQMKTGAS